MNLYVNGIDADSLSDVQKEALAVTVLDLLQEDFDVNPDSVGVEGYGGN